MSAVSRLFPVQIRPMTETDFNEVMAIELQAYPFPWTEQIMRDCLRVGYCCRVLADCGRIEAYGVMSVAAGEAHLLNLCVRPESQRTGLARRLLAHLLELARAQAVQTVFLEVRPSNVRAIRLYQAAGFCEVGRRRGYYPGARRREDALVMAKELITAAESPDLKML